MTVVSLTGAGPEHLTLRLSDESEVRTTLGVVTKLRLFAGKELDGAALEQLRLESARALGREKALTLAAQRPMSARELRTKLAQKGLDADTADYCVAWITEHGLIDEERYAAAVVRHYAGKGYGEGRVRQELQRRGIPRELCDGALEAMPAGNDRLDRYLAAHLRDPEDRDEVRRVSAALYRRGFSGEEIRAALGRARAAFEFEE